MGLGLWTACGKDRRILHRIHTIHGNLYTCTTHRIVWMFVRCRMAWQKAQPARDPIRQQVGHSLRRHPVRGRILSLAAPGSRTGLILRRVAAYVHTILAATRDLQITVVRASYSPAAPPCRRSDQPRSFSPPRSSQASRSARPPPRSRRRRSPSYPLPPRSLAPVDAFRSTRRRPS